MPGTGTGIARALENRDLFSEPGATAVRAFRDILGNALMGYGTAVPSAVAGYNKGALFLHTDEASGVAVYSNVGTIASCNFTRLNPAAATISDGSTVTDAGALANSLAVLAQSQACAFTIRDVNAATEYFVFEAATQTLTNKTLTSPTISGGSHTAATTLSVASSGTGNLGLACSANLTGTRNLTLNPASDAAITLTTPVGLTSAKLIGHSGAASAVQGDVLYFNGTAWTLLVAGVAGQALLTNGAGANPSWGTPSIASATVIQNNATLNDAGANDAILSFTEQTVSAPTLTVPDFAGVNDTFVFVTLAQTLAGKTLTAPTINRAAVLSVKDSDNSHQMGIVCSSNLTANRNLTFAPGDAARTVTLAGDINVAGDLITSGANSLTLTTTGATNVTLPTTGTLATIGGTETLTAKTLTTPVIASMLYSAGGNAITFQNAIHTVIGRDTTDTLTNKSLDCDGTGNALTNVNANELDSIVPGGSTFAVPFILTYTLTNQAAAVNIFNVNAPFKFQILRAWSISTSADGGTWKLNNGAGGAGTDITNAVTVAASDQDLDEPSDYDNAAWQIAANGSLSIVPDGAGLLDCEIYIECIRVD